MDASRINQIIDAYGAFLESPEQKRPKWPLKNAYAWLRRPDSTSLRSPPVHMPAVARTCSRGGLAAESTGLVVRVRHFKNK